MKEMTGEDIALTDVEGEKHKIQFLEECEKLGLKVLLRSYDNNFPSLTPFADHNVITLWNMEKILIKTPQELLEKLDEISKLKKFLKDMRDGTLKINY
jgi:hypothetical protein